MAITHRIIAAREDDGAGVERELKKLGWKFVEKVGRQYTWEMINYPGWYGFRMRDWNGKKQLQKAAYGHYSDTRWTTVKEGSRTECLQYILAYHRKKPPKS